MIKHLIAPVDRWLYQVTGGRVLSTALRDGPVLLLTTTGRRTGKLHTTPVFFLRDAERLVSAIRRTKAEARIVGRFMKGRGIRLLQNGALRPLPPDLGWDHLA